MNACLVGYGYWGKILHAYLMELQELNLIGICDHHYNDSANLDALIANKKLDCAFICLPIEEHYDIVKRFLLNGIHIFCEKPLCKSASQTAELLEIARTKGLVLFTDYIYVYSKSIVFIKENIDRFGNVLFVEMELSQFGHFYKNDDVFEVLGVHLFSVIAFWFENAYITVGDVLPIKTDSRGKIQSGIVKLKAGNTNILIKCSLTSAEKIRKITLTCDNGIIQFDALAENTVIFIEHKKKSIGWETNEHFARAFDEGNNLRTVVMEFVTRVTDNNPDRINENITQKVAAIMNFLQIFNKLTNHIF